MSSKVITVVDRGANQYELNKTKLVEANNDGYSQIGRSVTRSAIAKFLQANKGKRNAYGHVRVYHPNTLRSHSFGIELSGGLLSIGCKTFTSESTKQIRRWAKALAQTVRTKKSSGSLKAKAVAA